MTRYKLKDFDFIERIGPGGEVSPELAALGRLKTWTTISTLRKVFLWEFPNHKAEPGDMVFVKDGEIVRVIHWRDDFLEDEDFDFFFQETGEVVYKSELEELRDRVKALEEVLAWYGKQAWYFRSVYSQGDLGRRALDEDGGRRAIDVLGGAERARAVLGGAA